MEKDLKKLDVSKRIKGYKGYNSVKSSLSRAISSLEETLKKSDKSPETTSNVSKLRLSGSVQESFEKFSDKEKKVRDYRENWLESIVEYKVEEFKKVLNTPKGDLITSIEKDVENYATKAKLCIESNDGVIKVAGSHISSKHAPQAVQIQTSQASSGQWEQFRPQSNLEPQYLEKDSNHLEVSKFCQNLRTYINMGLI